MKELVDTKDQCYFLPELPYRSGSNTFELNYFCTVLLKMFIYLVYRVIAKARTKKFKCSVKLSASVTGIN